MPILSTGTVLSTTRWSSPWGSTAACAGPRGLLHLVLGDTSSDESLVALKCEVRWPCCTRPAVLRDCNILLAIAEKVTNCYAISDVQTLAIKQISILQSLPAGLSL